MKMFNELCEINKRPEPYEFYTADELWTDEHTSKQMLKYHLNESVDAASRNREFIERSVEWIASKFEVKEGTKIADFGCGPGLYSNRLAKRGAMVTGIDFSSNSLEYASDVAAKDSLKIDYVQTNYLEFETDSRFDLIIMIMCDYCALSPEQRGTLLRKFSSLLNPDGSVLLDVYSLGFFEQKEETALYERNLLNGFWSAQNYFGFLNSFKYQDEKVLLDKYTIIEETGKKEVYNWLQCFSPEALKVEFKTNGLRVHEIYSNVAGDEYREDFTEFSVIANKKG
jgi:cyclopropane fatty-acyl-phospholipid synthase-like methyltransferase